MSFWESAPSTSNFSEGIFSLFYCFVVSIRDYFYNVMKIRKSQL